MEKNKNYQRLDKLIIDSFISLCQNIKADTITVSMICKKADINRTTFYNHYKDIWEIIEVIENSITIKVTKILDSYRFDYFINNSYDILSKLNLIILENPEYYQKLYEISEAKFFIDKLKKLFMDKFLHDESFIKFFGKEGSVVHASFFVGGLANLYSDWFNKKINYSLDVMSRQLSNTISICLLGFKNRQESKA
ncbi:MAG: TetR/AcrR family transcriptional regulator C-terminal domain-containing protein [Bacilli bacterium]